MQSTPDGLRVADLPPRGGSAQRWDLRDLTARFRESGRAACRQADLGGTRTRREADDPESGDSPGCRWNGKRIRLARGVVLAARLVRRVASLPSTWHHGQEYRTYSAGTVLGLGSTEYRSTPPECGVGGHDYCEARSLRLVPPQIRFHPPRTPNPPPSTPLGTLPPHHTQGVYSVLRTPTIHSEYTPPSTPLGSLQPPSCLTSHPPRFSPAPPLATSPVSCLH